MLRGMFTSRNTIIIIKFVLPGTYNFIFFGNTKMVPWDPFQGDDSGSGFFAVLLLVNMPRSTEYSSVGDFIRELNIKMTILITKCDLRPTLT